MRAMASFAYRRYMVNVPFTPTNLLAQFGKVDSFQ